MMTLLRLSIAALAILSCTIFAAMVAPAAAEEIELFPEGTFDADPRAAPKNDDAGAEEQALRSAAYCDQYGPDYTLVPGTTTCIKATSHLQVDVYVGTRKDR